MKNTMKNIKIIKIIMVILVVLFSLFTNMNTFAETINENSAIEPTYVRSYWWQGFRPTTDPIVVYIEEGGYRGYISRLSNVVVEVGGLGLSTYGGTLYHPSVKDIPAPVSIDEELTISRKSSIKSKYVEKVVSYPYNWANEVEHIYPLMIFYNDSVYKGYISHTDYMPVDKTRDTIHITYGGYVYSGGNYPAPTKIIEMEK